MNSSTEKPFLIPTRLELISPGDPHCEHVWAGKSTPTPTRQSWIKCGRCGQHYRWENNR